MPGQLEEIDSTQYITHYLGKAWVELGSDPVAFLQAAIAHVQQESGFLQQPGGREAVMQMLERAAPAAEAPTQAGAPAAAPPPQAATPAAAWAAGEAVAAAAAAAAVPATPAAVPAAAEAEPGPSEGAEEKEGEEAEPSGADASGKLAPNAGNGASTQTYSWTQTLGEVVVTVPLPPGTKGRMMDVVIKGDHLRLGFKGQPPILDGELHSPIKLDDSVWAIADGKLLEVTLAKAGGAAWWPCVVKGEPEIDLQKVEPESSKLSDLDPEMRATVEKMMYDQRQKAMGLPTSDEEHRQSVMQKFMSAHPEMDFSQAKMM